METSAASVPQISPRHPGVSLLFSGPYIGKKRSTLILTHDGHRRDVKPRQAEINVLEMGLLR